MPRLNNKSEQNRESDTTRTRPNLRALPHSNSRNSNNVRQAIQPQRQQQRHNNNNNNNIARNSTITPVADSTQPVSSVETQTELPIIESRQSTEWVYLTDSEEILLHLLDGRTVPALPQPVHYPIDDEIAGVFSENALSMPNNNNTIDARYGVDRRARGDGPNNGDNLLNALEELAALINVNDMSDSDGDDLDA